MSEINDIRTMQDFRISSFSKYKKTEVSKAFLQSLIDIKKENACYWCAEMVCTGMFLELWNVIINFMSKYIYIGNPQLPKYISKRIEDFKKIVNNGYVGYELQLRNKTEIRKLFVEIVGIILSSKRKNPLSPIKLKEADFTIVVMSQKFNAKDTSLLENIYLKDDPKETFMAFNEFAYNISKMISNSLTSCYWIEWIIEYEAICKRKKIKCSCERRTFANVTSKYQMSIVWILWELLLRESKLRGDYYHSIVKSLLDIFCLHYSPSNNKKFKNLLYFAIYLLCENTDNNLSFIHNKDLVNLLIKNTDKFYKQMKNVEIAPNTEYLFDGLQSKKSNREKTIQKLEIIDKINH